VPYWQEYWFDVDFRDAGTAVFEPLGPEPPRQVPNVALRDSSLEAFVDALLDDGLDELSDLTGELRVRVFDTPTPGPDTLPVLERTGDVPRR
jgi:hypothetical protein